MSRPGCDLWLDRSPALAAPVCTVRRPALGHPTHGPSRDPSCDPGQDRGLNAVGSGAVIHVVPLTVINSDLSGQAIGLIREWVSRHGPRAPHVLATDPGVKPRFLAADAEIAAQAAIRPGAQDRADADLGLPRDLQGGRCEA